MQRSPKTSILLALVCLVASPCLLGAGAGAPPNDRGATGAAETRTETPAETGDPEGGLGSVSFPTSGAPDAQRELLRGLAALHSFWYPEARRHFERARELDPDFAMATWGEAMTYSHPIWHHVVVPRGRRVLEELGPTPEARAAKAPTEREREYLAAVEILYFGDGDPAQRNRDYEQAMARLSAHYPDDFEAAVFHALAIEGVAYGARSAEDRFPLLMKAAAILEELFDRKPRHPGVLHYLIHAYDDPVHAPLGLRPARLYAQVAPAAPHALHMPSHIFVQLGLWSRAAASNADAWQASVDWVEREGLSPVQKDYHSLEWLLYAQLQQGRWNAARKSLSLVQEASGAGVGRRIDADAIRMEARSLIERASDPSAEAPSSSLLQDEWMNRGAWLADALSARRVGDPERARRAAEHLAALSEERSNDNVLVVMTQEAQALAELAAGHPDAAVETLTDAAALADERLEPPSGPPDTLKPAHELLGETLESLGRHQQALDAFEVALRRMPRRALSLLGAARASAALGDETRSTAYYREYLDVRKTADPGTPGVEEARSAVTAAGSAD